MYMPPPDLEWETYAAALAHRAKELRKRLGITQDVLAERTGISRNLIQNIERGHATGDPGTPTNPALKTLYALSYGLEVPPAVLLPDLGRKVQRRSPSVARPPKPQDMLEVDIVWPRKIETQLPEDSVETGEHVGE